MKMEEIRSTLDQVLEMVGYLEESDYRGIDDKTMLACHLKGLLAWVDARIVMRQTREDYKRD